MITARIIADSINPVGVRLTSFILTYPRFIHAEFMTHRVFSRNAASSRAIPIAKMIEAVQESPAWPEQWGSNKPGMQAGEPLGGEDARRCLIALEGLRETAIGVVGGVSDFGLHKQVANRYLEPWAHITVLATASGPGLNNFFALRASPFAQPEFQVLAYRMLSAYLASHPGKTPWGGWHVPNFSNPPHSMTVVYEGQIRIATARCARLSYLTFDGKHSPDSDMQLHDKLAASGHWSPFEHCAQAVDIEDVSQRYEWSNFDSEDPACWQQYRKRFKNENQTAVDLPALMATKPDWVTL